VTDRETNYLILKTLQQRLPESVFKTLLSQVSSFFSDNLIFRPVKVCSYRSALTGAEIKSLVTSPS